MYTWDEAGKKLTELANKERDIVQKAESNANQPQADAVANKDLAKNQEDITPKATELAKELNKTAPKAADQINEGAKILEEKIAIRPSDIDIVWINGYGWPVYRGGPMFYADTVGLAQVVAKLDEYGPKLGANFTISPLLRKLAADGKRFQDMK